MAQKTDALQDIIDNPVDMLFGQDNTVEETRLVPIHDQPETPRQPQDMDH
ncbi:MAG: hypothetical protein KJO15_11565 [Alphaproteobacteria bacterium]|nr:hypothetical protein [Alphaproteobacteria bacterium]NNF72638.1 hypothetical protein [Paracoccaceae bacterium]